MNSLGSTIDEIVGLGGQCLGSLKGILGTLIAPERGIQLGVAEVAPLRISSNSRNAKGQIGFAEAIEGAIFQNRSIPEIHRTGDAKENDIQVIQAGCDAVMGLGVTTGRNQCRLLLKQKPGSVGDQIGGIGCDAISSIKMLEDVSNTSRKGSIWAEFRNSPRASAWATTLVKASKAMELRLLFSAIMAEIFAGRRDGNHQ